MINKESVPGFVTVVVTLTLCIVVIGMVGTMMVGMFDSDISNDKIFEAITPAFQTIIGGFIGLITGIKIGQDSNESD
jgi:ABC-type transporter Mla maintaining outer membrane lipid asymmetry permease subunit MlaE